MDPITEGTRIFKEVADKFGNEKITDIKRISALLGELIGQTQGQVILDFLDAGSWDSIERFELNDQQRLLTLVWHDYPDAKESEHERELREMVFPASLYALSLQINSIAPIIAEEFAVFLINGYAKTDKEMISIFKKDSCEFELLDTSFFEKRIIRDKSNQWEIMDFHCTPIYSLAIIPKNCGLSSGDSKKILYQFNLNEALGRLSSVISSMDSLAEYDRDSICEKANTVRRILESVLKIECCFRELEIKGNYSTLMLGALVAIVKKTKDEKSKEILNKMVEMLNELSHDSGKPVELTKAKAVAFLVLAYTEILRLECSIAHS